MAMDGSPKKTNPELAERERWISTLDIEGKEEIAFELDMLLRGLDRFFNLDNLFLNDRDQIISRDFTDELRIISQLLRRLVTLTRRLLETSDRNAHHFQRYVETELADDFMRDILLEKSLSQSTPRESLYLLYDALSNMNVVVDSLLIRERLSFSVFKAIGELLRKEILQSRYFNPLQSFAFSPTYDRIHNGVIRSIVTQLEHPVLQKRVSFVFLAFFRMLHYMRFIDPRSKELEYLKSSLLIFSLVRSEARALLPFLEHGFKEHLFDMNGNLEPESPGKQVPDALKAQASRFSHELDTLAYQMEMELRKVSAEELANAASITKTFQLRGMVENAHGILTNLFQQTVVNLARIFEPDIEGKAIFPQFESRKQQSKRLLEDLLGFLEIMNYFEEHIETNPSADPIIEGTAYLRSLKKFLEYFKNNTMMLLRFNDLTEFGEFFKVVHLLAVPDLQKRDVLDQFLMRSKYFKIFLQTTVEQIQHRQDLQDESPNMVRVRNLLESFLPKKTLAQGESDPAATDQ